MKRIFILISILLLLPLVAGAEDTIKQLQEVFSQIPNASLGNRASFENEFDMHQCAPLTVDNKLVAWVYRAFNTDKNIFIMQCLEDKSIKMSHAVSGYLEFGLFILDPMDNWKPKYFEVPEYKGSSNPSFCK